MSNGSFLQGFLSVFRMNALEWWASALARVPMALWISPQRFFHAWTLHRLGGGPMTLLFGFRRLSSSG